MRTLYYRVVRTFFIMLWEAVMKRPHALLAALISVSALFITGCYTVIMVPRTVMVESTDRWAYEETVSDTAFEKSPSVVNNYYIYDDWAGHWHFDPFWDSPYHWQFSSWWWGAYYDPWYSPWSYYGYGWWPYSRYSYWGPAYSWYSPWYYDPYWVYADGYYAPEQRRPFDRRESVHTRRETGDPGFASVSEYGASRVAKESDVSGLGLNDRRMRQGPAASATATGSQGLPSSSERRMRRTTGTGEVRTPNATSKGSSSGTQGRSGGSERRERRSSPSSSSPSSSSGSSYSPPSSGHSGSHGSSGSSSGSSGRSSSSSSSGSGSSGHRTRR